MGPTANDETLLPEFGGFNGFPFRSRKRPSCMPISHVPANIAAQSLATTSTVPKHEESDWTVSVEVKFQEIYDGAVRDTEI